MTADHRVNRARLPRFVEELELGGTRIGARARVTRSSGARFRVWSVLVASSSIAFSGSIASAQSSTPPESSASDPDTTSGDRAVVGVPTVAVDRVVVRYSAPEIGGVDRPRYVYERVLAFEARVEALADVTFEPSADRPYRDIHVRGALERHIAETIMESLEVSPPPSPADMEKRVMATRLAFAVRAGGAQALDAAARAEGLSPREVLRIVQRQARASIYLDRMVAPMLEPSDAQLQVLHQSGRTEFSKLPYPEIARELRRWYVARRLREAVIAYYESARTRVVLSVVRPGDQ